MEEPKNPEFVRDELCLARMNALEWKLRFLMVMTTLSVAAALYEILRGLV